VRVPSLHASSKLRGVNRVGWKAFGFVSKSCLSHSSSSTKLTFFLDKFGDLEEACEHRLLQIIRLNGLTMSRVFAARSLTNGFAMTGMFADMAVTMDIAQNLAFGNLPIRYSCQGYEI